MAVSVQWEIDEINAAIDQENVRHARTIDDLRQVLAALRERCNHDAAVSYTKKLRKCYQCGKYIEDTDGR